MGIKDKDPSRLKGTGLDKLKRPNEATPRLLTREGSVAPREELSETNLKGKTLVQRDSGAEFLVTDVHSPAVGDDRRPVANLESTEKGKVTLRAGDLLEKLRTPGSPWRLKE